jgi:membrane protease subunit HflC
VKAPASPSGRHETSWVDKRLREIDMDQQQVLSTDQLRLEVDAFARYRVVDPLRMYIRARSESGSATRFARSSAPFLRNELGPPALRRSARAPSVKGAMENIRRNLDTIARQVWRADRRRADQAR